MPRIPTIRTEKFPYHVRARSNNRDWYALDIRQCWEIFVYYLKETQVRYNFNNHLFLLMSNHFHWIVDTPDANIDTGMQYFMMRTSCEIGKATNRINKIYGARYKATVIDDPVYYANAIRYVLQNPIRAGICQNVEAYSFSSYFDRRFNKVNYSDYSLFIPENEKALLIWANKPIPTDYNALIKNALGKTKFKFSKKSKVTGIEHL